MPTEYMYCYSLASEYFAEVGYEYPADQATNRYLGTRNLE